MDIRIKNITPPDTFKNSARDIDLLWRTLHQSLLDLGYTVDFYEPPFEITMKAEHPHWDR
jgi:hypothetical protein